jgi:hypothetical protein
MAQAVTTVTVGTPNRSRDRLKHGLAYRRAVDIPVRHRGNPVALMIALEMLGYRDHSATRPVLVTS